MKLPSELREHPLLLLPIDERRQLIEGVYREAGVTEAAPDGLWNGQLGQKNRQIFEALLTAYRGDLARVLDHVQVERYYVSRRYRCGAVTIGPQMAVDAHERQITADRSLNSLPASLSAVTMFEPFGELVDASGGIVEYSDLLKRPLDAWKYLLLAIETGEVSLPLSNLPINAVMVASSNELHLAAFKEHHEYNSFRGRIQFVRVPYLLDYTQEQGIYDAQIVPQVRKHVAPHSTYVAALWWSFRGSGAPRRIATRPRPSGGSRRTCRRWRRPSSTPTAPCRSASRRRTRRSFAAGHARCGASRTRWCSTRG